MTRSARLALFALALPGWFAIASPAVAETDAEVVKREIPRLLDAGWRKGAQIATVEKIYVPLAANVNADVRVPYAMALVAIKLNRYPRALELLDEATQMRPKVLPARRARIWTLMILQRYQAALDEMNVTSQLVTEHEFKPEQELDTARFLGRMLAWLAIQGKRDVAEGLRLDVERKITGRFQGTVLKSLEDGRSDMTRELTEQQLTLEVNQAEAKESQAKLQAQRKEDLAAEGDAVEAEMARLADKPQELMDKRDELLGELQSKLAPLDDQFAALSTEASGVSAAIQRLRGQIGLLQIDFENAPTELDAARIAGLIDGISLQIPPLQDRYGLLDREARQVNAQRRAINQQAQQIQRQCAAELQAIERQLTTYRARLKRIASDRTDASKPVTGNTPGVRSQTAQTQAFTFYQPFPLEEERRLVLESLR